MTNPVQLEIFKSLFHAIAEEMGATLKRTAFSPNIKERRDYSCGVFDNNGDMVAQGDHMPVHFGSMPLSVKAAIESPAIGPGDVVILNYRERMTRHAIASIPDGTYEAEDFLDNDSITNSPVGIRVSIRINGNRATIDFSNSDPQAAGSINAVYAITASAVFYVFRTL